MKTFTITSSKSGADLGTYAADDERGALDAMARDAGYRDHAAACEASGDDGAHLVVREAEVTDADIAALQDEAAKAGDHEQVRLCQIALIAWDGERDYRAHEQREAREACVRAILDAGSAS